MPRARSSGALSMESKLRKSASPFIAKVFVIAAVSVVFPWSTCPIVPTLMCGFVRSNFFFAMAAQSSERGDTDFSDYRVQQRDAVPTLSNGEALAAMQGSVTAGEAEALRGRR